VALNTSFSRSQIDTTAVQALIDARQEIERWTNNSSVEFHFASILLPWIRQALIAGGFGTSRTPSEQVSVEVTRTLKYSYEYAESWKTSSGTPPPDIEAPVNSRYLLPHGDEEVSERSPLLPVIDAIPFFHFDLTAALQAVDSKSRHERIRRREMM